MPLLLHAALFLEKYSKSRNRLLDLALLRGAEFRERLALHHNLPANNLTLPRADDAPVFHHRADKYTVAARNDFCRVPRLKRRAPIAIAEHEFVEARQKEQPPGFRRGDTRAVRHVVNLTLDFLLQQILRDEFDRELHVGRHES